MGTWVEAASQATVMGLLHLLPILALSASCHGAALPEAEIDMDTVMDMVQEFVANPEPYMEAYGIRAKRSAPGAGFKEFHVPFAGIDLGIKYKDQANRAKGGEAFIHVDDLASLIPAAHSKKVKLHFKFDGGAATDDGLFNFDVDYHLEHKDGHGMEEGNLKIVRQKNGGKWHTNVKTTSTGSAGTPIIPARISNLEFEIESDRARVLNGKYMNPTAGRDITWNIKRDPGKSIKAVITRGGVTSTIEGKLKKTGDKIEIEIDADIRGQKYTGMIVAQTGSTNKLSIKVKKGAESIIQANIELKMTGKKFKLRGKYNIMGGKAGQGTFKAAYDNHKLTLEADKYKMDVEVHFGRSIKIEAFKDGVSMWTYETLREDKSTGAAIIWEAQSKMTLNPASMLHGFIQSNYPFGAFETRSNNFRLFINKNERNFLLRKFKIDFDVIKDGAKVVEIKGDTTASPYQFSFDAPNLMEKLNFPTNKKTLTIDHVRGSHFIMESNIAGGLKLDAKQSPNAGTGGRNINIEATRAGTQMWKYDAVTSKVNDATQLKVGLKGDFKLNPNSALYNMIVSKYRILTPFSSRKSDLEFFWDKVNKNVVMNKFYAKAKIDKDGTEVANILISTNQKPYKLHVFLPAVLGKLRPGMTEVDVDVDHMKGHHLEVKVNHAGAKWSGFRIAKTGSGNQREIYWNGKKLGTGTYELSDKRFSTTQTLSDGRSLTSTITWKNNWDSAAFLLDNKVHVNLDGTERQLDLNMVWGMNKVPDFNMATPENGHMEMTAVGHNARWGDYSVSRNIKFGSAGGKLTLDVTGDAAFSDGLLAPSSPIQTEVKLSMDMNNADLDGKFKKVMAGKEYSVVFHPGFTMPSIKVGA